MKREFVLFDKVRVRWARFANDTFSSDGVVVGVQNYIRGRPMAHVQFPDGAEWMCFFEDLEHVNDEA